MSEVLAVFTPTVGLRSETFIASHISGLLPSRCVVVADGVSELDQSCDAPMVVLAQLPIERVRNKIVRLMFRKLGFPIQDSDKVAVSHFLRKHGVTVAMGEYLHAYLPWLPVCRGLGIRTFAHGHGYDVSVPLRNDYWRREYLKYRQADGVITVNQVQRNRLVALGLDATRIHVIPCGVNVPECFPRPMIPGTRIRCLSIGRMVPKKAPILCLDAFRRAVAQVPELHLDYVGEGDLLSSAQHFVKVMNLGDKVTLHGGLAHAAVLELLGKADILVMHCVTDMDTGDEEGLPVSILEGMANGLPVVSTRHAGIPEAVLEGVTGFLVNEGDSAGMSDHIVKLALDRPMRLTMGDCGRARAIEMFSLDIELAHLREVMGLTKA